MTDLTKLLALGMAQFISDPNHLGRISGLGEEKGI
ncbi:hypothetical protein Aoki45_03610 [Algoriphagus sp. oki45]|nr:hypothetical protein Aoki45_03610 [Algoriphagus sp. oki45]